ncbi:MAG: PAS domain S-box protein [Candidatus Xenobiia bacterium LiM19]
MMDSERTEKRYSALLTGVFLLFATAIIAAGYFSYRNYEKYFRVEAARQLSTIADLKVNQIVQWRKERMGDASLFYRNTIFASLTRSFLSDKRDRKVCAQLDTLLNTVKEAYQYENIFLFDRNGVMQKSYPESSGPCFTDLSRLFPEILKSQKITVVDLHRHGDGQPIHLSLAVPVIDRDDSRPALGYVVLVINPENYLYPMLTQWPVPSNSSETLLVRREGDSVLFLNELRFMKNSALTFRISLDRRNTPAVRAVLGEKGIVEGNDYRNVPVIACIREVPDSPWFIVARMDAREVYAPLRERLGMTIILVAALLIASVGVIALIWRHQRIHFYQERYEASRILAENERELQLRAVRLQALLDLHLLAQSSKDQILDYIMMALQKSTQSEYSFAGLMDEAESVLTIHRWSTEVMAECDIADRPLHFPVAQAGLWGDSVRLRKPVMVNEYGAPHPGKKGYPDGHVPVSRFLTVPVFDGDRIVAVATVANKKEAYDSSDSDIMTSLLNTMWEILRHSETEEKVKLSEERFRNVFEHATVGKSITSIDGKVTVNEAFCQMTGYTAEELAEVQWRDITFPDDIEQDSRIIDSIISGERECERWQKRYMHKSGKIIWADISTVLQRDTDGNPLYFVTTVLDITNQVMMEESQRETNEYLENLITHANAPIIVWNSSRQITKFNGAFETLSGYSAPEVIGRNVETLFPLDRIRDYLELIERAQSGEKWETAEIEIRRKDGMLRTVLWNSANILDSIGKTIIATIAQGYDITERKMAEKELIEKNIELERMTYTISHDMKSPLVTIKTFLGYLEQDIRSNDATRREQDMQYMKSAAEKMGNLLDDLLEMSRIGRVINPPVLVTFSEIVAEAVNIVAGSLTEREVEIKIHDDNLTLLGDRTRLVEVWQNLVENAVKFMGGQEKPMIDIGIERIDKDTLFYVRDNGIGIDCDYHDKIFGLFERLNPKIEGTGLGLALVKRIIELYGGIIRIESEGSGSGSCFRFTLPKALVENKEGETP